MVGGPGTRLELLAYPLVNDGARLHRGLVIDLHRFDLLDRELRASILTEQPDRVGPALAAMAHHVHIAPHWSCRA